MHGHGPGKRSWLEIFGGCVWLRTQGLTDSLGKNWPFYKGVGQSMHVWVQGHIHPHPWEEIWMFHCKGPMGLYITCIWLVPGNLVQSTGLLGTASAKRSISVTHALRFEVVLINLLFWMVFELTNKKVLLRECKRHTACRVASTPYVVLPGSPHQGTPGQGTPARVAPSRVPPGWTWQGTPPLPHGILGNVAKHYGIWVPPEMWTDWKHYLPPSFGCGR